MANEPHFNPNNPKANSAESLRNRAVTDVFEPGSTFKSFVVARALDDKVINAETTFDCEKGRWAIGRNVVNDTHPHGLLTAGQILQVSSNIGAAKIAQLLGRDRLVDTLKRFGFAEKIGLNLPSEGKGSVPYPKAEITFATQAFGQGLTASAVQIAQAYGALANDGTLMRAFLISKVVDADGQILLENRPTVVRQVVGPTAAHQVVSMLEGVVEKEGTAPKACLDEYRVAGKTGTAQKVDPVAKGYSDKRIASFVGMVPAENPRLVIAVIIDEPKTDVYGGLVAAPAFREMAKVAMAYLGVEPSRIAPKKDGKDAVSLSTSLLENKRTSLTSESAFSSADEVGLAPVETTYQEGEVRIPDVKGHAARMAVSRLLASALEPRLGKGSGMVVSQTPLAGTVVRKGTPVTLQMATSAQ